MMLWSWLSRMPRTFNDLQCPTVHVSFCLSDLTSLHPHILLSAVATLTPLLVPWCPLLTSLQGLQITLPSAWKAHLLDQLAFLPHLLQVCSKCQLSSEVFPKGTLFETAHILALPNTIPYFIFSPKHITL